MKAKPVLGYTGRGIASRSKEKIFGAHEAVSGALYRIIPLPPPPTRFSWYRRDVHRLE